MDLGVYIVQLPGISQYFADKISAIITTSVKSWKYPTIENIWLYSMEHECIVCHEYVGGKKPDMKYCKCENNFVYSNI